MAAFKNVERELVALVWFLRSFAVCLRTTAQNHLVSTKYAFEEENGPRAWSRCYYYQSEPIQEVFNGLDHCM